MRNLKILTDNILGHLYWREGKKICYNPSAKSINVFPIYISDFSLAINIVYRWYSSWYFKK